MRKLLLMSVSILWTLPNASAQEATIQRSESLIVALQGRHDTTKLDQLKARLGVTGSKPAAGIDAEIWQLPREKVLDAFKATRRSDVAAIDYSGSNWRTLFLPASSADLAPAQAKAVKAVSDDHTLSDVQVVRLRADEITNRLLTAGSKESGPTPKASSLLVNVAPGLNVLAARSSLRKNGNGALSWTGTATSSASEDAAVDLSAGEVSLVVDGDRILGSVDVGANTYSIIPLSGGLHAIAKVQKNAFPPEHPPEPMGKAETSLGPTPSTQDAASPTGDAPPPQPLMIGVAFTKQALEALQAGRPAATAESYAQLAIAKTNVGFQESGISARVALAGTTILKGQETGDFESMTDAIVSTSNHNFDEVHAWRRKTRSDVVIVMVALKAYCGNAAGIHVGAAHAFAIVNYDCAVSNLSFPHEFGHLLGARHDPDTDPLDEPFAYAHGYRHANSWRTIMAYAGGECVDCVRINRWADPDRFLDGVALGTRERNNDARLMREMLPLYAQFMP